MWRVITHAQVLVVVLAFAFMIFLSFYFMSGIEHNHLLKDVENVMSSSQSYIEADLMEPRTTLGVVSENIRIMLLNGATEREIDNYLKYITGYITNEERLSYATAFFGFFDVFNNKHISGAAWVPASDYVSEDRPWYKAAVEAEGKIGITEPFFNAVQNVTVISFARRIFDENGRPLGIIGLNIMLDRIREYAINTYITADSYGILFDKNFMVLAHPNPAYLGRPLSLMNDGIAIQNELLQGREIVEREALDYNKNKCVFFMRRLNNGWYLGVVAYSEKYYQSIWNIGFVLGVLGVILAAAVSAILLRILASKKRAEERTQIMLDSMPLCANFWDKNFKNIDCNQEALKLLKMPSKKEYLDRFFYLSPEYQPDGRLSKEKSVEILKKAFDEGHCHVEWVHRTSQNELIPCEITLVRVKYRNEFMVASYTRDLRELKSIMAKMRETDECMQVLFNTTPLSCFMFDKDINILEINHELLRVFGLNSKQEFINNLNNLLPEYQPSGKLSSVLQNEHINEAFEEGYCRFEWVYQNLNGELLPTEVSLVRVKFRGEYAVAAYIRDLRELKAMIAEMRRAEIAEESNKAKSDFLAKMSHEIRTPMNAILGITEIQLQDSTLPQATKEALARIYTSGDLLLGIINDILDLSKIEAGKLELSLYSYDAASLIHDIVQLNVMRYESKPIEFKLNVSDKVPSVLIGDELRIKQVLNNILSNAFKYTQEGMVNLSVFLEDENRQEGDDLVLVFRIRDTGQGMSDDQVLKLGDKYLRFNMDTNRTTEGTGLGMNITRNLIQMMNGRLTVDSVPGMGSIFTVYLPQGDAGFSPFGKEWAENLEQLNLKSETKLRNVQVTREFMPYGRVLVVDDVETNLYVARGLLAPYGLSIDTAISGFESLDKIRDGSVYDIIFMDHMMPKMDGIETVKNIRDMGYKEPVIALTANALAGQAQIFLDNGFDGYISKPIDIRQLNAVLNKMIRDKQTQEVLDSARKKKNSLFESIKQKPQITSQLYEFFIRDAEKTAVALEAIYINKCRRADDIPSFIINIHAMKSALANVGENELSETALRLEQMGRDKEIDLVLAYVPSFLEGLRKTINKFKQASNKDSEPEDENDPEIRQYLRERLLIIQAACARYDKKGAKETLTELRQKTWSQINMERFNSMAEHLLHSEFEETSTVAEEILSS
jgi:signal transduction histidine kinase/CheY-like chemotaxis protein/HPt (histidine-containing phosphotransfer) domain-containing protein